MCLCKYVLFYFLETIGVVKRYKSRKTIKDDVGEGGENQTSLSLSCANKDGPIWAPCDLCEG